MFGGETRRMQRRLSWRDTSTLRDKPFALRPRGIHRLAVPESLTHVIASWVALDTRAIGVSCCSSR